MAKNREFFNLIFIFTAIIWSVAACCAPKNASNNSAGGNRTTCLTTGVVKDLRGLDGCTFLIVLENGQKLLPARLPDPDFQFREGQKVRFDYKKSTDGASICMAEDMIVDISCLEETD